MAAIAPGVTEQLNCFGSYVIYGVATFLSLASSIILMIIDFIIPCITNKKVINVFISMYLSYLIQQTISNYLVSVQKWALGLYDSDKFESLHI